MSAPERPADVPRDRPLTRNEGIAAAVLVPVAVALVARAMTPSWTAVAVRTTGGLIFLAIVLAYGWIEDRRPRRYPWTASALVILGAGATAGALVGALETNKPGVGASSGLLLGALWLAHHVRARRRQGRRGDEASRPPTA